LAPKEKNMSYDVNMIAPPCPHCGRSDPTPDLPDPTYNLTPIFDLALTDEPMPEKLTDYSRETGLRILSGRIAQETLPQINKALERLTDPSMREKFVALEPENKWGTLDDAIAVMMQLRHAATEHPDFVWEIR
jgi:hypothetical protein